MASWQFGGGWEREPAAYAVLKDRCSRELIASLERSIPGLARHIELSFAATPRTIASLTANIQGAIMGWLYQRGRGLPCGNFLQMRGAVLTPVPRLLTAGHWSFSPGGSPVAVLTGKVAAEHLLKNATDK
jgi:phytoene dehydrogenase-like protein